MSLEIKRLHLAKLSPPGGDRGQWPVHGFVVTHPGGAVLVDTGVGGPEDLINDWRVVNVSAADALAELDMSPADISLVINTHLHFDHCGQNAVFKHAPFYVQRAELDRARRESAGLAAGSTSWARGSNCSTATPRSCPACRSSQPLATPPSTSASWATLGTARPTC